MKNCIGEPRTSLMGYGRKVFEKYDYTCVYCGRKLKNTFLDWMQLTVEHVIPYNALKSEGQGMEKDERNLRAACAICNNMRTRINVDEFRNLPFEERIEKTLEKKKAAILARRKEFERYYDECVNPVP